MHQSLFSYNITRPYPFRWFTPLVVVGGILFTILFSVINLATNGYYLKTIYTTNPNGTIAEKYWFTEAPWSWGDKLRPECQVQEIPIGYQFFTTNSGLSYTLTNVWQYDESTGATIPYPSLRYLNHTLRDCQIDSVIFHMRKADDSWNGYSPWWSWDDSSANAYAHCTVDTSMGPVNASFSTYYKAGPQDYSYVIQNNYTTAASMWWGTRLLSLYWSSTLTEMGKALYPTTPSPSTWNNTPIWTKGQMVFTPDITTDITATSYFTLNYFFLAADSSIHNTEDDRFAQETLYNNNSTVAYSGPITEAATWSKIMSSMILTDLGDFTTPNILQDPTLLQWALRYPDDTFRDQLNIRSCPWNGSVDSPCDPDWYNYLGIQAPTLYAYNAPSSAYTPMNRSYELFNPQMGPLGTKFAEIYLQYACSVPERKDTGTLILTILISDLVFLSASWSILTYVAGVIVARRDEMAMACKGHGDVERGLGVVREGLGCGKGLKNEKMGKNLNGSGSESESDSGFVSSALLGGQNVFVNAIGDGAKNGYLVVR